MNKIKQFIYTIMTFFVGSLPAYCQTPITIKQAAMKFLIVMGGVAICSVVIFVGLSLYNKFFFKNGCECSDKEDSLSTPSNVQDAVNFFIKKNKLR